MKLHLGELLVEAGIITVKTLDRALARQKGSGRRLGVVLEEMGVITQEELVEALGQQFGFKTAQEIASRSFPGELLELVPGDYAYHKLVFPLEAKEGVLSLAVTDPFDIETIEYLSQTTSMKVETVLATRNDIVDAVRQHYHTGEVEGNGRKVLVVDDSPALTSVVESALRREGYDVVIASDGVEGLKVTFSDRPDLIICDASMPRMDGYALMRAVKVNPTTAGIPMILLTSKASPEEEHRALKSGFHDFIAKPVMAMRVVSRVNRAFELQQLK